MFKERIGNSMKCRLLAQVAHVLVGEAQAFEVFNRRLNPRRNQIGALLRQVTDEQLKSRARIDPVLEIPRGHRQFVEVNK